MRCSKGDEEAEQAELTKHCCDHDGGELRNSSALVGGVGDRGTMSRDPSEKGGFWGFPGLPYEEATSFNLELLDGEKRCLAGFVEKYKVYTPLWEYGYYFLGRYLDTATVTSASALPAGLFADGYGALRGSFVVAGH